jgi:hypothetical protein
MTPVSRPSTSRQAAGTYYSCESFLMQYSFLQVPGSLGRKRHHVLSCLTCEPVQKRNYRLLEDPPPPPIVDLQCCPSVKKRHRKKVWSSFYTSLRSRTLFELRIHRRTGQKLFLLYQAPQRRQWPEPYSLGRHSFPRTSRSS